MSDQDGFVVIHRKIMDWEWYTDPNTAHLFIHCILRANHKDKVWHGVQIKRGSFITSYEALAFETGLTVRQIRTALDNHLLVTGELKKETNNRFTLITVVNYDKYQDRQNNILKRKNDKQTTSNRHAERQTTDTQPTCNRHASDKQPTTNNNDNNNNNETMRTSDGVRHQGAQPSQETTKTTPRFAIAPEGETHAPVDDNAPNLQIEVDSSVDEDSAEILDERGELAEFMRRRTVRPPRRIILMNTSEWLAYCKIKGIDRDRVFELWGQLENGKLLTDTQIEKIRRCLSG